MKPRLHAISSAKRFGGKPEDYQDIHDYMDSTKAMIPDVRHRAIFHSSFGCYLVEDKFGIYRLNSNSKEYATRDVAEQHILEDLGFIPTLEKWLKDMPIEAWMGGKGKKLGEELSKAYPFSPDSKRSNVYIPDPNPAFPHNPTIGKPL
jgi:hypothetical protein